MFFDTYNLFRGVSFILYNLLQSVLSLLFFFYTYNLQNISFIFYINTQTSHIHVASVKILIRVLVFRTIAICLLGAQVRILSLTPAVDEAWGGQSRWTKPEF